MKRKFILIIAMCAVLLTPCWNLQAGTTTNYGWDYGVQGQDPWWATWVSMWGNVDTELYNRSKNLLISGTLGAEKVINGTFDADTNWTKGANWAISGGKATHTAGSIETISQDLTEVLGEVYKIVYTVSGRTAGTIRVRIQGQNGLLRSTNATFTEYITGTDANVAASRNLHFIPSSPFNGSIDDVSVKIVTSGTLTVDGEINFRSPLRCDADIFLNHGGIITKGDAGYGKPNIVMIDQTDAVAAFFVGGGLWSRAALYVTGYLSATIDDNGDFQVSNYGVHADDAADGGMIYLRSDIDAATLLMRLNATANSIHFLGKDSNSHHNIAIGKDYIYWYGLNLWTDISNYEGGYLTAGVGSVTLGARTLGSGTDNIDLILSPAGAGNVRFGSYTAKGAEAFSGFITIKDSAGNPRKTMVCE